MVVVLEAGEMFLGVVREMRGELFAVLLGLPRSSVASYKSDLCASCSRGAVYCFGLLFLHLLMPKPTATNIPSKTSITMVTQSGASTIWLADSAGQSDPHVQLNCVRDPVGQNVPSGHLISSFPFGQ